VDLARFAQTADPSALYPDGEDFAATPFERQVWECCHAALLMTRAAATGRCLQQLIGYLIDCLKTVVRHRHSPIYSTQ
jgi:hypothetical protein